jgi:hypothetical protein
MLRVYHGGTMDRSSGGLWATPDADYAAAFAQLHEAALWMLTLDVAQGEVLDLTDCGLDVSAVATNLLFAGNPARVEPTMSATRIECYLESPLMRSELQAIASCVSTNESMGCG